MESRGLLLRKEQSDGRDGRAAGRAKRARGRTHFPRTFS